MTDVVVAIPALNEADTVGTVVSDVVRVLPSADVVVVNDGSQDATAHRAAEAGAVVLTLPFTCGVGAALGTAYRYAADRGAQAVLHVDADGQHDATQLRLLLDALEDADVVVGSRFGPHSNYSVRGPRRLSMQLLSRTVSRVTGSRLDDVTSGFRASGPAAIGLFAKQYPAAYLGDTVESLVLAWRAGLRIGQVPVIMRQRQGGRASHGGASSALHVGRAYLALYAAIAGPRREEAP